MRFRVYAFRWVMLVLYAMLAAGLFLLGLSSRNGSDNAWWLGLVAFTFGTQALFIFGAGTRDLLKPVHRKRRLLAPVVVAAGMLALLTLGLACAFLELTSWNCDDWLLWVLLLGGWLGWGVLFFVRARRWERFVLLQRLANFLLAGSLVELLACIPSHLIVIRRPGCLVGIGTAMGLCAGIYVMLWSFGPGLLILFLRPKWEAEKARAAAGEPEPPPSRFRFSLASLTLFVLWLGAVMASLMTGETGDDPATLPVFWVAVVLTCVLAWRLLHFVRRWERLQRGGN